MLRTVLICLCFMLLALPPVLAQDGALDVTELTTLDTTLIRDRMSVAFVTAWSPDSAMLAVANTNHVVEIWDTESGEQLATLQTPFADALAFSPSGQFLAVGGTVTLVMRVDKILEWGTLAQDDFGPASQEGLFQAIIPLENEGQLVATAFATDNALLTYTAFPTSMIMWDISEPMDIPDLSSPGQIEPPSSVELTPPENTFLDVYSLLSRSDGLYAALVARSDTARPISIQQITADFESGTATLEPVGVAVNFPADDTPIASISPDLSTLRIATSGSIQFFDAAETGEATAAMVNEAGSLPVVNPAGTLILEASSENSPTLTFLSPENGTTLASVELEAPPTRSGLIFSPDGSRLMVVTASGDIKILELSGEAAAIVPSDLLQTESAAPDVEESPSGCTLDLGETISLLESAQDAADSGDLAQANELVAEARADLDSLDAQCEPEDTGEIDLSQSVTLDTNFGTLSLDYPGGWLTQDFDENAIVLGNQESAFELDLRNSEPSPVEPGNALILIGAVDLDYYGQSSLGKNASASQLLEALASASTGAFTVNGGPAELVVNDHPAASLVMQGDGLALNFMLVKLAMGTNSPIFGQVVLITAPDELEDYQPVQLAVATSMRLTAS